VTLTNVDPEISISGLTVEIQFRLKTRKEHIEIKYKAFHGFFWTTLNWSTMWSGFLLWPIFYTARASSKVVKVS